MEKDELLKIENQLCFKIYSVSRGITRAYRPILEKISLTYPQYLVMLFLWENGDSKMKEISKTLFLDSGTLTPVIKKLENTGYIKRERDKSDERDLIVSVTEEGKKLKEKALEIPEQILCKTNLSFEKYTLLKKEFDELLKQLDL